MCAKIPAAVHLAEVALTSPSRAAEMREKQSVMTVGTNGQRENANNSACASAPY